MVKCHNIQRIRISKKQKKPFADLLIKIKRVSFTSTLWSNLEAGTKKTSETGQSCVNETRLVAQNKRPKKWGFGTKQATEKDGLWRSDGDQPMESCRFASIASRCCSWFWILQNFIDFWILMSEFCSEIYLSLFSACVADFALGSFLSIRWGPGNLRQLDHQCWSTISTVCELSIIYLRTLQKTDWGNSRMIGTVPTWWQFNTPRDLVPVFITIRYPICGDSGYDKS